jgi:dihydroorotase
MKTLISSATIIDHQSPYHGKVIDLLISNGKIVEIGEITQKANKTINAKGMYLSIGWFDMRARFGDPGLEHKEDIQSGLTAAQHGGFTGVALLPNTQPVIQSKSDIQYLLSRSQSHLTDLYPIAAVTKDTKGEDFTEMIDLHQAGAIAFSDGEAPLWQADILLKSLQYLQKFDGLLINKAENLRLNLFGTMNEGVSSTMLGMKGMPTLSEDIAVQRDLSLLEYAGGRLHISNISSAKSIDMIRKAKKSGLQVTCDVASFQPLFDDQALSTFDTNYKVNPPFRNNKDNQAIIKGLKDGTIDVIVSAHTPHDEECKKLEFDLADFGITGLQTVASDLATISTKVDIEQLIHQVTYAPRIILKLDIPEIAVGETANLTLFDPAHEWTFDQNTNQSKAVNSPYFDSHLTGKAVAVFNNGQEWIER